MHQDGIDAVSGTPTLTEQYSMLYRKVSRSFNKETDQNVDSYFNKILEIVKRL